MSSVYMGDGVAQLVASDSRSKGPEVRIPLGAQEKFVSFSGSKLSCMLTRCWCACVSSMSEFGGLRKDEKTKHALC